MWRKTWAMTSRFTFKRRPGIPAEIMLFLLVLGILPPVTVVRADSIVIGRINPPDLNYAAGVTFDGEANPLVVDGFGALIWRIDINDASVVSTHILKADQENIDNQHGFTPCCNRALDYDVSSGNYYVDRRQSPANDTLYTVDPQTGAVNEIGLTGTDFTFLDQAIDPTTADLWLITDNGGGQLWSVNKTTGIGTMVQSYGGAMGDLTSIGIGPTGRMFVTSIDGFIYEISSSNSEFTQVTTTDLSFPSFFRDFEYDAVSLRWYGIEDRRSKYPFKWYLREITNILCVDCDDGDLCTTDNCDPVSGCFSEAVDCDDADACTIDSCDPLLGCESILGDGFECSTDEDCDACFTCQSCVCDAGEGPVTICHIPPGNPAKAHTITVNARALPAHLAHGDVCGLCEDPDGDGHIDLGVEDLDSDDNPDFTNEDVNENCHLDLLSEECFCGNCDGVWEPPAEDCNDNGIEDFLFEDIDEDGHLDAGERCLPCLPDDNCLLGGDGNMHADVNCDGELSDNEDLDSDGNHDTDNEDTNGNCTCEDYGLPACDPE